MAQDDQVDTQAATEHVQITPLGLSAEQMKLSNPEAVASIAAKAADTATATERQRLADLTAAFGGDSAFLSECIASGAGVIEAKAKKFDALAAEKAVLATENTRLQAENDDLKRRIDATKIGFQATEQGDEAAPTTLETRMDAVWNASEGVRHTFMGNKDAFVALMTNEPSRLEKYEVKN